MIFCVISINAQPEESIYSFGFNSYESSVIDGWVISTKGFDAKKVSFLGNPMCEPIGDGYCVRLDSDAVIPRVVSTTNYHSIRVEIGTSI